MNAIELYENHRVVCDDCRAHDADPKSRPKCPKGQNLFRDALAAMKFPISDDFVGMVRQFHETFGIPLGDSWHRPERRSLRSKLIIEEGNEFLKADMVGWRSADPALVLDALVDLVYVCIGAALEYGFDFEGAFAAVHRANMAKLGDDGQPIRRADGKILKPTGWTPPDLTPFVGKPKP